MTIPESIQKRVHADSITIKTRVRTRMLSTRTAQLQDLFEWRFLKHIEGTGNWESLTAPAARSLWRDSEMPQIQTVEAWLRNSARVTRLTACPIRLSEILRSYIYLWSTEEERSCRGVGRLRSCGRGRSTNGLSSPARVNAVRHSRALAHCVVGCNCLFRTRNRTSTQIAQFSGHRRHRQIESDQTWEIPKCDLGHSG